MYSYDSGNSLWAITRKFLPSCYKNKKKSQEPEKSREVKKQRVVNLGIFDTVFLYFLIPKVQICVLAAVN
ncbi:MAG: hypothetical protein MJA29_01575, partial [Candidatus Omnitrophica bacterium]|nr:hypothetical protein [Candidatus Omnitrophota bacterium]